MMRAVRENGINTQFDAFCKMGKLFRDNIRDIPEWFSDEKIGLFVLK